VRVPIDASSPGPAKEKGGPILLFSAVNVGRKEVQITHFGGTANKSAGEEAHDFYLQNDPNIPALPWKLAPGDKINFPVPLEMYKPHYRTYWLIDTTDRKWKVTRSSLRALRKSMAAKAAKS
jgi:hypothetical protein